MIKWMLDLDCVCTLTGAIWTLKPAKKCNFPTGILSSYHSRVWGVEIAESQCFQLPHSWRQCGRVGSQAILLCSESMLTRGVSNIYNSACVKDFFRNNMSALDHSETKQPLTFQTPAFKFTELTLESMAMCQHFITVLKLPLCDDKIMFYGLWWRWTPQKQTQQ